MSWRVYRKNKTRQDNSWHSRSTKFIHIKYFFFTILKLFFYFPSSIRCTLFFKWPIILIIYMHFLWILIFVHFLNKDNFFLFLNYPIFLPVFIFCWSLSYTSHSILHLNVFSNNSLCSLKCFCKFCNCLNFIFISSSFFY